MGEEQGKPKTKRCQLVNLGANKMKETKIERTARLLQNLSDRGFSYTEAKALLRIERTLHRWAEMECGDGNAYQSWAIERDEETNKPFLCVYPHKGPMHKAPVADRETAALKRLNKIMAAHPDFVAYHQGDCRGCMVYIVRKSDVGPDEKLNQVYTRGLAVCI